MLPLLVVVTGAPGVGKTTLARALAHELKLPLLSKDDVKEALFDSLGTGDREWSRKLGAATFDVLFLVARRLLDAGTSCILDANFTRAEPLRPIPAELVQIYCTAPRDVVSARYASRERHPGHLDREIAEELSDRFDAGEWQQLDLPGETIIVDTTVPVDVDALARRITA